MSRKPECYFCGREQGDQRQPDSLTLYRVGIFWTCADCQDEYLKRTEPSKPVVKEWSTK